MLSKILFRGKLRFSKKYLTFFLPVQVVCQVSYTAAASQECLVSLSSSCMVAWHCLQLESLASCDWSLEFSVYAVLASLEVFSGMIWF